MTDRERIAELIAPEAFNAPVNHKPVFNGRKHVGYELTPSIGEQLEPITDALNLADRILAELPKMGWRKEPPSAKARVTTRPRKPLDVVAVDPRSRLGKITVSE